MNVFIREGMPNDIPAVLNLIKELAIYEKAPNEVEVTENEMLNWGFGENKLFQFFVAEKDKELIGLALYYFKYSTWKGKCIFLEDIIVTDKCRKEGVGSLLFKEVVKRAKIEKVKRLEWQVLSWNTSAIEFYKKFDAKFDEEWVNCKLSYETIQSFGT